MLELLLNPANVDVNSIDNFSLSFFCNFFAKTQNSLISSRWPMSDSFLHLEHSITSSASHSHKS